MQQNQTSSLERHPGSRNPFGVMDVPDPNDTEVTEFAAHATLDGAADDANAAAWPAGDIGGAWSSRWNGGADPTMPGDAPEKWKQGRGELNIAGAAAFTGALFGARPAKLLLPNSGSGRDTAIPNASSPNRPCLAMPTP